VLQQFLKWIKSQKTNDKYVKKEIKVSIENFQSLKERLKLMKLRKIEQNDVKDIKASIEKVKSIEEHLKLIKEDEKNIQTAIKTATDAVQSMEKIINEGVWLLGHV
jgi:lipopolysaccharide export LptBFGC system permease protein LptF